MPMRNSTNAETASAMIVPKTRNAVCVLKPVKSPLTPRQG
jgi:hypothetical protein